MLDPIRHLIKLLVENYYVWTIKDFLKNYGWFLLFGIILAVYLYNKIKPKVTKWIEVAREKKDPDLLLAREEAIQRAREKQQQMWLIQSQRNREIEEQKRIEREEQKLREREEALNNLTNSKKMFTTADLPLCRGGSGSSYRPPQRKCPGGGCGR